MAVNDAFSATGTGVADAGDFIIDGTNALTGAAEVQEIVGDASAKIYREFDPDGDGTFEVSVQIEALGSAFHTQLNALLVSQSENVRLRVNNDSGGSANYGAVGMEVND